MVNAFVFCLRADGTRYEEITLRMCVDWLVAMFPDEQPPLSGVWVPVPSNLMPPGATVCYFEADAFRRMRRRVRQRTTAPADMRPLITPRWRDENPQEWDRLWNLSRFDVCPVCHERPDVRDGPMNSDVPTRCTHWACVGCWARIAQRDMRCPICRDNLSHWLRHY